MPKSSTTSMLWLKIGKVISRIYMITKTYSVIWLFYFWSCLQFQMRLSNSLLKDLNREYASKTISWTQWRFIKRGLNKDMESDGSMRTIRMLKDIKIENRLCRDWDQIKMLINTEERKQKCWISTNLITYRIKMDQLSTSSHLKQVMQEMELRVLVTHSMHPS